MKNLNIIVSNIKLTYLLLNVSVFYCNSESEYQTVQHLFNRRQNVQYFTFNKKYLYNILFIIPNLKDLQNPFVYDEFITNSIFFNRVSLVFFMIFICVYLLNYYAFEIRYKWIINHNLRFAVYEIFLRTLLSASLSGGRHWFFILIGELSLEGGVILNMFGLRVAGQEAVSSNASRQIVHLQPTVSRSISRSIIMAPGSEIPFATSESGRSSFAKKLAAVNKVVTLPNLKHCAELQGQVSEGAFKAAILTGITVNTVGVVYGFHDADGAIKWAESPATPIIDRVAPKGSEMNNSINTLSKKACIAPIMPSIVFGSSLRYGMDKTFKIINQPSHSE